MWRVTTFAVFVLGACAPKGHISPARPIAGVDSSAALLAVFDTILRDEPTGTITTFTPACVTAIRSQDLSTGQSIHWPLLEILPRLREIRHHTYLLEDCLDPPLSMPTPRVEITVRPVEFYGMDSAHTVLSLDRLPRSCDGLSICVSSATTFVLHIAYAHDKWRVDRITVLPKF